MGFVSCDESGVGWRAPSLVVGYGPRSACGAAGKLLETLSRLYEAEGVATAGYPGPNEDLLPGKVANSALDRRALSCIRTATTGVGFATEPEASGGVTASFLPCFWRTKKWK